VSHTGFKLYFEYKGNYYYIISNSSIKNPTTREWLPAICYKKYQESPTRIYVREEKDFKKKFKKVELKTFEINFRDEVHRSVEMKAFSKEHAFDEWTEGNWNSKDCQETDCQGLSSKDDILDEMTEIE